MIPTASALKLQSCVIGKIVEQVAAYCCCRFGLFKGSSLFEFLFYFIFSFFLTLNIFADRVIKKTFFKKKRGLVLQEKRIKMAESNKYALAPPTTLTIAHPVRPESRSKRAKSCTPTVETPRRRTICLTSSPPESLASGF